MDTNEYCLFWWLSYKPRPPSRFRATVHSTASSLGYDTEVLLMGTTFVPNEDFVVEFKFSAAIICYALAQRFHNNTDVAVAIQPPSSAKEI